MQTSKWGNIKKENSKTEKTEKHMIKDFYQEFNQIRSPAYSSSRQGTHQNCPPTTREDKVKELLHL